MFTVASNSRGNECGNGDRLVIIIYRPTSTSTFDETSAQRTEAVRVWTVESSEDTGTG